MNDMYQLNKVVKERDRMYLFCLFLVVALLSVILWVQVSCADVIVLGSAPSLPSAPGFYSGPGHVTTVIPPAGMPTHSYTSPGGVTTIQPPVGLPTYVYPGPTSQSPTTVIQPNQLPTMIYKR